MQKNPTLTPLFNVDSALHPLTEAEISAEVIDARICMLSFKNFDFIERMLPHVLEVCTHSEESWRKLVALADKRYWLRSQEEGVLVFEPNRDCGCLRTYRFRGNHRQTLANHPDASWTFIKNEQTLYEVIDSPAFRVVYSAWVDHQNRVMKMPTVLVTGRLENTSVEKAVIFSKGNGCVVCGATATAYAATTMGTPSSALMIQLPVCTIHLESAKSHPTIFSFLVQLFQMSLDVPDVMRRDSISDELVPVVHNLASEGLSATPGGAELRERGWHLWMNLPSGWCWLLRLNTFADYSYMLFEPGMKVQRYRADSAPHHPEQPFFPNHEHSRPDHKRDEVAPSFLYGHPLFDLKRLKAVGLMHGAY